LLPEQTVPARILIVEDETLVAMELGLILEDLGHQVAGIASDSRSALEKAGAETVDLAIVDVHLADGPTGPEIGRRLAAQGVSVLFMTGNPSMIGPVPSTIVGVMSKPTDERLIGNAVAYALACREGRDVSPPAQLRLLN